MTDTALIVIAICGWLTIALAVGLERRRRVRAERQARAVRENRAVIERAKAAWRRRDVPVEDDDWTGRG